MQPPNDLRQPSGTGVILLHEAPVTELPDQSWQQYQREPQCGSKVDDRRVFQQPTCDGQEQDRQVDRKPTASRELHASPRYGYTGKA
jgi:hypothetical protein